MHNYDIPYILDQLIENFSNKATAIFALVMYAMAENQLQIKTLVEIINDKAEEQGEEKIPEWLYRQTDGNRKEFNIYLSNTFGEPNFNDENYIFVGKDEENNNLYADISEYKDLVLNPSDEPIYKVGLY